MKMRKATVAFWAAICMLLALGIYTDAYAVRADTVYAETDSTVWQGEYGYCYVYLDDLTDLASLNVSVYYDTDKLSIVDSYNQVDCNLYDSSDKNGCLQYSYIFSGEGSDYKTGLFYFRYRIHDDAVIGDTCFDIVISDAYNTALESVPLKGSRCSLQIAQRQNEKSCFVFGTYDIHTSVQEEFTLDYYFSEPDIASGSMVISYDPELFEFVELTQGGFLDGKVVDVNASLPGAVYVSFVGTEYSGDSSLLHIRFRAIKNVETSAQIKLAVTDLFDLNLQSVRCDGYSTEVIIQFEQSYTEEAPSMGLIASYDRETNQLTLSVTLEAGSHLGAGDFVITFDAGLLVYSSAEKTINPTFFHINEKNVSDGVLKFSIISLNDITETQTVLRITFDVGSCMERATEFQITGSGLSDSLTEPIVLSFVGTKITLPALDHSFVDGVCERCGVPEVEIGDVNGDGKVNARDARALLRYIAGLTDESEIVPAAADFNGDGRVNARDARAILRHIAGLS